MGRSRAGLERSFPPDIPGRRFLPHSCAHGTSYPSILISLPSRHPNILNISCKVRSNFVKAFYYAISCSYWHLTERALYAILSDTSPLSVHKRTYRVCGKSLPRDAMAFTGSPTKKKFAASFNIFEDVDAAEQQVS